MTKPLAETDDTMFNFYDLSSLLSTTIWLLLDAVMLLGGILLFRVEKRFYPVSIILGAAIGVFINAWYLLETMAPAVFYPEGEEFSDAIWLIQMGISLIGYALIVYGVFTLCLLQWRRARAAAAFPTEEG